MARGGKREGSGRPQGAVNKVTASIREAAQEYSAQALQVLVTVATTSESDAAKVAAANSILDRAHGKPTQTMDIDANVKAAITEVRRTIVDPGHRDA
jgi:hypothetical protein